MNRFLCRLGFHTWSNWEDVGDIKMHDHNYQNRYCIDCNKKQIRRYNAKWY